MHSSLGSTRRHRDNQPVDCCKLKVANQSLCLPVYIVYNYVLPLAVAYHMAPWATRAVLKSKSAFPLQCDSVDSDSFWQVSVCGNHMYMYNRVSPVRLQSEDISWHCIHVGVQAEQLSSVQGFVVLQQSWVRRWLTMLMTLVYLRELLS